MKKLKDLLYPRRCVFCEAFLDKTSFEDVCPDCREKLPYTKNKAATRGEFFSDCLSPLYYTALAREAIHRFKFMRKPSYAGQMGRMIAYCILAAGVGCDIVTWVPVSIRRLRKRGYCQAKLLAEVVAGCLGAECRPFLKKQRHTPPQSSLSGRAARKANVSGAFRTIHCGEIAGRKILLIDDVITTGATLSECTRMLLMAGAREVCCATLCKSTMENKTSNPGRKGKQ